MNLFLLRGSAEFFYTTSASLPGRKSLQEETPYGPRRVHDKIFHWKNWAFLLTFFSYEKGYVYDFYRWDVAGRPPANRSRRRRRRKKFGDPQLEPNHRAQLRSHARLVHEEETEIDFPVGVPKGLTPPTSNILKTIKIALMAIGGTLSRVRFPIGREKYINWLLGLFAGLAGLRHR